MLGLFEDPNLLGREMLSGTWLAKRRAIVIELCWPAKALCSAAPPKKLTTKSERIYMYTYAHIEMYVYICSIS